MDFREYEEQARTYALYPKEISVAGNRAGYLYPAVGLAGEAGEALEQIKKAIRNDEGKISEERRFLLLHELGDIMWYLANLAAEIRELTGDKFFTLETIAVSNILKLAMRRQKGEIKER